MHGPHHPIALLMGLLWLAAAPSAARSEVLFEDGLKHKLAEGWTWMREDKPAWRVDGDGLHVRNQFGTLWGTGNDARNILLRALPNADGPLAAEVVVRHKPVINAEQAGLIYHVDDDHYVKLVYEALDGKSWIVLAREAGGKGNVAGKIPLPGDAPRLRLVIHRDAIRGQVLGKNEKWEDVGNCEHPGDAGSREKARIGLVSHGGPHEVDRWATFNDFQITSEK